MGDMPGGYESKTPLRRGYVSETLVCLWQKTDNHVENPSSSGLCFGVIFGGFKMRSRLSKTPLRRGYVSEQQGEIQEESFASRKPLFVGAMFRRG